MNNGEFLRLLSIGAIGYYLGRRSAAGLADKAYLMGVRDASVHIAEELDREEDDLTHIFWDNSK